VSSQAAEEGAEIVSESHVRPESSFGFPFVYSCISVCVTASRLASYESNDEGCIKSFPKVI
jgi:hypothetical protein